MELTENQRYSLYEKLGAELKELREASSLDEETAAYYASISPACLNAYESGERELGKIQLYLLMRWAAVFGKKLKIELEDFSLQDKLESYERAKRNLKDLTGAFY